MSNSALVSYTKISPNKTSPRNHVIDTITIHCTAGNKNNTAKQIANLSGFTNYSVKNSSCNYAVGGDGSISLIVDEKDRSWCSSSGSNDHRAITIEVASNTTGTEVNDAAYQALLNLLVDICKRNGIKQLLWKGDKSLIGQVDKQNMSVHRWFANKACPGNYLYNLHPTIAAEVNKRLGCTTQAPEQPTAASDSTEVTSYRVRVKASVLNIRAGAGTGYKVTGSIKDKGVYTIVAESTGTGATKWGKLKSGAGWISLDYCTKL